MIFLYAIRVRFPFDVRRNVYVSICERISWILWTIWSPPSLPWHLTALNDHEGSKLNWTKRNETKTIFGLGSKTGTVNRIHPLGSSFGAPDGEGEGRWGRLLRDAAAPVFGQRSRIVPRANEIPLVTVHDLTMRRRRILQGEILPGSPC